MSVNPLTGVIRWAPNTNQIGTHTVTLLASDGRGGGALQNFTVRVIAATANHLPVITSTPRTNATPGLTYRYDVFARDPDGDTLTFALSNAPAGMGIDSFGRIAWSVLSTQAGSYNVTVTAADPVGATAVQTFPVIVAPDLEPPVVGIQVAYNLFDEQGNSFVEAGTRTGVRVTASDNVGVTSRTLRIAGESVALNTAGFAQVLFPVSGQTEAVAEARDAAGNVAIITNAIPVVDPNATGTVAVVIHSPTNAADITRPVEVVATISSLTPLREYRLEFASIDGDLPVSGLSVDDPQLSFQTITNALLPPNTFGLTNAVLGRFDPTVVLNGGYLIRVSAYDVNFVGRKEGALVFVSGNLKFGEFRLEFTDLSIPVAGIPITVRRVYDTRDSRRQGDFGYGWSLGVQDARLLEVGKSPYSSFGDETATFTTRTRVFLTTPDGRRVGFSFAPEVESGALFFGAFFRPAFRGDPGVYDRLEPLDPSGGFQVNARGEFVGGFGLVGYDPSGYRLVTRDNLTYEYDQRLGLQRVTDLNGNRLLYTRDGIFHVMAGTTNVDQSIRFVRDVAGRIREIIDPNGKALRYTYDSTGDLRSFSDQVTNTTRYLYHTSRAHYLTNIIDPLGYDALRLEYDAAGRLTTVRDANGTPSSQDFDADTLTGTFTDGNGNVTNLRFDEQGNEVMRSIPGIYTNYFGYDANNNLLASTNGRGFATNYTYDAGGNVTSITDALSNRTSIAYNEFNKPVGVTNALGQTLSLRYNPAGQLLEVVNNAGHRTMVTRDTQGHVETITDATGTNTTIFDYAGGCSCGRPGKIINPDNSFRLYEYNSFGQTNRIVNELGAETIFHHDDGGRLRWMRDPLTNFTYFHYNGPLLTNVVDALGRETRYEYDALNRTNRIIDAENGVVEFRYDGNGNRTHVIDPVTNVTTFIFDPANRLRMQIAPLGFTNFFDYDAAGNRSEAVDRNGRKRTFAFDALNRMTNELWWEGVNVVRSMVFGYNELGVQVLAADPAARYDYSYDALNRLERVVQSAIPGQPDFTLDYTYSALGQVETVTDNWGVRVGSSYDSRSRLASRNWQGPGVDPAKVDFSYDVTGNRIRTDRYSDLAGTSRIGHTTNAYNHAGIVTNITHLGPTNEVLAKYDYNFDDAYQITRWAIGNQLSDFAYDRTGQLTNALNTAQSNENFRFDANGNRVGAQSGGNYVVGANNQILSDGTNIYFYDFEGNMEVRENTQTGALTIYEFDHRNRLVRVIDSGSAGVTQIVEFAYDAMNRRLSKTVNGRIARYLYNNDDSWADLDGTSVITARYLHGVRIDELLARRRTSDGLGSYLTDHLGTVRDIANAAGAVVAHVDYSSFGQVLGVSNPSAADRFLFTGRELDGETGLYFYRARYYSASLGRFVNQDPLGFEAEEFNNYRYVLNSPSIGSDAFGLAAFVEYGTQLSRNGSSTVGSQLIGRATQRCLTSVAIGLFNDVIFFLASGQSADQGPGSFGNEVGITLLYDCTVSIGSKIKFLRKLLYTHPEAAQRIRALLRVLEDINSN